jgi:hypothetical protein
LHLAPSAKLNSLPARMRVSRPWPKVHIPLAFCDRSDKELSAYSVFFGALIQQD